eukprot:1384117-Pleurochrysis_carterae.AAC.1
MFPLRTFAPAAVSSCPRFSAPNHPASTLCSVDQHAFSTWSLSRSPTDSPASLFRPPHLTHTRARLAVPLCRRRRRAGGEGGSARAHAAGRRHDGRDAAGRAAAFA